MNELQKRNLQSFLQLRSKQAEKNEGELVAWFEGLGGQDRDDDLDTQFRLGYNSAVQELSADVLARLDEAPAIPGLGFVLANLAVALVKAEEDLAEAKAIEEANGHDDALQSMDRSEAEGRVMAYEYALQLVKGIA